MLPYPLALRLTLLCALLPVGLQASTLTLTPASPACGVMAVAQAPLPPAAQQRLPQSQAALGARDIAWAWLGSPTARYPHAALGSTLHAASLQVLPATAHAQLLTYTLPLQRVFEDRVPRLADLDGDGRDEIILVEADALRGAALVVFGLRDGTLVELARGPHAGSTFRWLNPVGVADFDGDGRLDLASVTTPTSAACSPCTTIARHASNPMHAPPRSPTTAWANWSSNWRWS